MYTSLAVKLLRGGGPLCHKQGDLIHQFGVCLGCDLKIRLLLFYENARIMTSHASILEFFKLN